MVTQERAIRAADRFWMRRALELARCGSGRTRPNPAVGAVLVDSSGALIAQDYHHRAGEPHAEALVLEQAGSRAAGSTLYVTLEPCSHHGKTPPCAELIIRQGVARVVAAMHDPNPVVSGRGFRLLREAGIEVVEELLVEEAVTLNRGFLFRELLGRPHITIKAAVSLDGKLATHTGHSRWVTGKEARLAGHRLRNVTDAILVGVGTVRADNPRLTCRIPGGRDPLRCILDSRARTPVDSRLLTELRAETWVFVTDEAPPDRIRALARNANVRVLKTGTAPDGRCRLQDVIASLQRAGVLRVLVEGGSEVQASVVDEQLVDEVVFFIAPKLVGGAAAPTAVGGAGVSTMDKALRLGALRVCPVGRDLLVRSYVEGRSPLHVYRHYRGAG